MGVLGARGSFDRKALTQRTILRALRVKLNSLARLRAQLNSYKWYRIPNCVNFLQQAVFDFVFV